MNSPQVLQDMVNGAMRRTVICESLGILRRGILDGSKSAALRGVSDEKEGGRESGRTRGEVLVEDFSFGHGGWCASGWLAGG